MGLQATLKASWLVGALSLFVYRPNLLTICLALFFSLLAFLTTRGRDLIVVLALSLAFLLYFLVDQKALDRQANQPEKKRQSYTILAYPDERTTNSQGRVAGIGRLKSSGERVYYYYQAKDPEDLARFRSLAGPTLMTGQGDLTPMMSATNFYQFDFKEFAKTKRITHQVRLQEVDLRSNQAASWFDRLNAQFHHWHAILSDHAKALPNPVRNYALALLLGSKDQTLYDDNPKIQELGLIHLFSLSGFHVAFLITVIRWLGRLVGLYQELTLAIMALCLIGFYWLTACPPILVRAVIAGESRIFAQAFNRRFASIQIWSWSLLLTLVVHPQILLTLGGQLSFFLTLALAILPDYWPTWQKGLFLSVLTFPLIVAQQYTWNLWQSLANLIAIPVFSLVILPVVLVAFFGQVVPGLVTIANWLVTMFDQAVYWLGNLPGQIVIGALPWPILLVLGFAPWFLLGAEKTGRRWVVSTWLFAFLTGFSLVHFPRTGEFTTFDIGQGDAALLREPYNKSVTLIDTGGKVSFQKTGFSGQEATENKPYEKQSWPKNQEGQARTVIVPYLHAHGISRINTLSLSHQDQDHLGDARVILTTFQVDQVLLPAGMAGQPAFLKKIQPYLGKARVVSVTDQIQPANLPLRVLHPFQPGIGENEDSIALGGRVGPLVLFTAGDLDQAGEKKILAKYPDFRPNLVKFGHHGSKTATNPAVMAEWQPTYGLISAGRKNRYGHPNQEVLEIATRQKMIVYDTRRQGMLRYVYENHKKGHFQVKSTNDLTNSKTTN
ncbi:DNA internalization-related competence protein ComEC/Rec2 [Fructobacillus evanidus]|uniref:Metallo-beta-lactamase superfamily (ComEC) n=1 Tax=Fructobacillus evanidus TaxID=3064281 RepID=A0ABN9YNC1_9LACO|nr:DNA uptake channel protein ComEC C-terminal domain [Fructobacillus sp. LMG 32999]CAK1230313.1 DNA uptake channel protein ComEC C-terminal domain [Fructobacillus sp. LMG 32999]CAK1234366.1 DNA uptake channel protein ComEC C-terminal domain [Fructobacillus sp. LMG 32999]CAK1236212.1 DNA uptake channel protein ComEC C-terminal domain [Fructobacillus sp. LMG 32999]CAK1238349.1 DNA uptake channel protein ComEC C-terminal domain [Fructobacillus sp. LMG 32999]